MNTTADDPSQEIASRPVAPAEHATEPGPSRTAIVVAGMHRAGTSALTRMLGLLGAELPRRMGSGADNEPGFWEPLEIVRAHDALFQEAGSRWDDVSPFTEEWLPAETVERYEATMLELLEDEYGDAELFVLKDPRICRVIPFWQRVLERFGATPLFVLQFRNPLEVADSLRRRDGFSSLKAQLLWLRHVLEAERFTRGRPRTFVSYDELLYDWMPVAARIADTLDVTWPRINHDRRVEIDRFLSPDHRHHSSTVDELRSDPRVASAVKRVYSLLEGQLADPQASIVDRNQFTLDEIYRELGVADGLYGPLVAETRLEGDERVDAVKGRAQEELGRLRSELSRNRRESADLARELDAQLVQARVALNASEAEAQRVAGTLAAAERELEATRTAADRLREAATRAAEVEQRLREDLVARAETLARNEAALSELEEALALSERRLGELQAQLSRARDETAGLRRAAKRTSQFERRLREELAGTTASHRAAEERAAAFEAVLSRTQASLDETKDELQSRLLELEDLRLASSDTERRLRGQLAGAEQAASDAEEELEARVARIVEQDAELSRVAKELRTAEQRARIARAQLDSRIGNRGRHALGRAGRAAGAPFVVAAHFTQRWSKVIGWSLTAANRPLARAYIGLRGSDAFDREFYLAAYRDVARSGMDPLMHYVEYGVRDRYDPSRTFSTERYLLDHPDLVSSRENPLLHSLTARLELTSGEPARVVAPDSAGSDSSPAEDPESERAQVADTAMHPAPATRASATPGDEADAESRRGPDVPMPALAATETGHMSPLRDIPGGAIVLLATSGERPAGLETLTVWPVIDASGSSAAGADRTRLERSEIEALRAKGAGFAVLDDQLLDADPALEEHLNARYRPLGREGGFAVYELSGKRTKRQRRLSHRSPGWSSMDVICLPVIDWNFRFQRPQQLMTQMARAGHRVFYVATTFQEGSRRPAVTALAENVWGVRLSGPAQTNIYTDLPNMRIVDDVLAGLDALRSDAAIDAAMTVIDLPFWGRAALKARERWGWKVVYDCMDEHGGFPTAQGDDGESLRAAIDRQEHELLTASDLVITTSRMLDEKVRAVTDRVVLVPNAADFEHFSVRSSGPLPASMPRPIIGYYGAISSWFDSEMVAEAARRRPEWSFVLAGRTTGADLDPLADLTNVHLLGELPYEAVAGLLHQFDVATIPFHLIDLTLATNPVKFYEYMSAGKPVVSVELPELDPYEGFWYPARTSDDFVHQIERALAEDDADRRRQRIELGRSNTWKTRYRTLESSIRPWYEKVAIVIVSFNNPDYLRMCLDSIAEKSDYPNYDVIIVDNGSDQSLIDEVATRCEHDSRLRLIAAGENLGFARANNLGIEAAGDADHIVLLNDDTVVTPGWLGKLVAHLRDSHVGLVGPVTSWAGNEARVDIPYDDDLDGLDQFAAARYEEHRGTVFDIDVLAMYCVAIRKSLLDRLGRLNERYRIGMFEDDDFAMRVRRAGLRVVCAEDVFVHHWGRASFRRMSDAEYAELFEENKRVFEEIWSRPWEPHRARRD